jgi:uncharacterized Zn finger protein (UPF0148 family)
MSDDKKPLSFVERMKLKALEQKNYGGEIEIKDANMGARDCPNCGAARAKQDGLTKCAYCNFEFIIAPLTDGLHIKKEDNSNS